MSPRDAIVVGAGHNGLVAATLLARHGLDVLVLERAAVVGGAARTEYPFNRAPQVGASTGAYLLGLFPPELLDELGLDLPLLRRDPHYHLPFVGGGSFTLGGDAERNREAVAAAFGDRDAVAMDHYQRDLAALRHDLAPSWLRAPLTAEETANRYVRAPLRDRYRDLVTGSAGAFLTGYGFESDLLMAMFAVTDAFPGVHGTWDTPGTGHNLLVHNFARLPGSDGTWMVVEGGLGTVTDALASLATGAGAEIRTNAEVVRIEADSDGVTGVSLADGSSVEASKVVVGTDPWRLVRLTGADLLPSLSRKLADYSSRPGTTLKLNLALSSLPILEVPEAVGATIHLLPAQHAPIRSLQETFAAAAAGRLPERPPIELYIHTAIDPSLRDDEGRHSAALFVQWVPNRVSPTWDDVADDYADRLLDVVDGLLPGFSTLVIDRQVLHPEAIEAHFGITGGNIFHVDNTFSLTERVPYRMELPGLYACGAGCHPAGSVIGAAGHNAATCVLGDM